MQFYSLHNHSDGSNVRFIDCINSVDDLADRAVELGYNGIALTDHACVSRFVELSKTEDRIHKDHPDFKIIRGNEIYLIDQSAVSQETRDYYHFILLAIDLVGYHQLLDLASRAWDRAYTSRGQQRVPTTYQDIETVVKPNQGHLIASTACVGGELAKSILRGDKARANSFIRWCIDNFGKDNFFLEIQPALYPEQITVNQAIMKLAAGYGLHYIVTTDSHYLNKEDFTIHQAFLRSKGNPDRETEGFYRYTYLMEENEIVQNLMQGGLTKDQATQAMENTRLIGERVVPYDCRCGTHVPNIKIPKYDFKGIFVPYLGQYPYIAKFITSDSEQDRYLIKLLENGMIEKHLDPTPERLDRLNTELGVVDKVSIGLTKLSGQEQHVSSYFLLMKEVIDISRNYSFVGCGRGSSSGFFINYVLDLVEVDPLKYNLPYWRFLNDVRFELPDIDTDLAGTKKDAIMEALREHYGYNNVLNCVTFKTETLKAATLTAMKGLRYSNDEANALAGEIPVNRGHVYTLKECEEGDETLELEPAPKVVADLKKYPNLYETIKKIEGLNLNASIHASAVYIFDNGYLEHNALMRAPNGTRITAFDMDDTNAMSGLKIDLLFTDAQTKLMKCAELLLNDHQIEWQGSLYATYRKYLHPDVLDYTTEQMWENMSNGVYSDLFQWDTAEGAVAIKKAQPRSVIELATINSAIRVQSDGGEQPIDRYIRFKNNIQEWYDEMTKAGLNQHEQDIMKKYLLPAHGVSMQQEDFMRLSMDPEITGFTLAQANKLRKTIAHKQLSELKNQKQLFFDNADKLGTSHTLRDYVWDYCIQPLAKYSFSIIHAVAYSIIALQEVNLAYHYNPLYWACACLCVNAGQAQTSFDEGDEDEGEGTDEDANEEEAEEEPVKKAKKAAPDYGKVAKAISRAQHKGVEIALPNINTAGADFLPDIKNNRILYSLKTVNCVSDALYDEIITHRPYTSLHNFLDKVPDITLQQVIGLIKAGCFDELENIPRERLMRRFIVETSVQAEPDDGKAITTTQIKKILDAGFQIPDMQLPIWHLNYRAWISDKTSKQIDSQDPKYYLLTDSDAVMFFLKYYRHTLNAAKYEYSIIDNNTIRVKKSAFDRVWKKNIAPLIDYFATNEGRSQYFRYKRTLFCRATWEKYCTGSVSSWEMEQMYYYHGEHELAHMQCKPYGIVDFDKEPEQPVQIGTYTAKDGTEKPTYKIVAIAGTVINANNTKHIVTLLTPDGVVDIKMYRDLYNKYRARISEGTGKDKVVLDEPWLKRGRMLLIYGMRRDNMFTVRSMTVNGYRRDVGLIEGVNADGSLNLRFTRRTRKEND